MLKIVSAALLFSLAGISQAQSPTPTSSPVISLDSEHGVVMRLIQELEALRSLAIEGKDTQASSNELVLIDFDELADVFELVGNELNASMQRKYGNADVSTKPGVF